MREATQTAECIRTDIQRLRAKCVWARGRCAARGAALSSAHGSVRQVGGGGHGGPVCVVHVSDHDADVLSVSLPAHLPRGLPGARCALGTACVESSVLSVCAARSSCRSCLLRSGSSIRRPSSTSSGCVWVSAIEVSGSCAGVCGGRRECLSAIVVVVAVVALRDVRVGARRKFCPFFFWVCH